MIRYMARYSDDPDPDREGQRRALTLYRLTEIRGECLVSPQGWVPSLGAMDRFSGREPDGEEIDEDEARRIAEAWGLLDRF